MIHILLISLSINRKQSHHHTHHSHAAVLIIPHLSRIKNTCSTRIFYSSLFLLHLSTKQKFLWLFRISPGLPIRNNEKHTWSHKVTQGIWARVLSSRTNVNRVPSAILVTKEIPLRQPTHVKGYLHGTRSIYTDDSISQVLMPCTFTLSPDKQYHR